MHNNNENIDQILNIQDFVLHLFENSDFPKFDEEPLWIGIINNVFAVADSVRLHLLQVREKLILI